MLMHDRASTADYNDVDHRLATVRSQLISLQEQVEESRRALFDGSSADQSAEWRAVKLTPDPLLNLAAALVRARGNRARQFRQNLFGDPVWDMLLDLFIARLSHKPVCVSSLCIAARVPASTALRWIRNLERHGEVMRRPDASDRRRVYVELSDSAFRSVERSLRFLAETLSASSQPTGPIADYSSA